MVLIFDCNSEVGAHVRSNLCILICLMHLIKLRDVTNRICLGKDLFSFMRAQHVLSYHLYKYLFDKFQGWVLWFSRVGKYVP